MSRVFSGRFTTEREFITAPNCVLVVSTSGASASAVTLWVTSPISIVASTTTTWPSVISTCWMNFLKPAVSTSTVYGPTGSAGMTKSPLASELAVRLVLVPSSVAFTLAPGITRPDGSLTLPRRSPVVWANNPETAEKPHTSRAAASRFALPMFIQFPPFYQGRHRGPGSGPAYGALRGVAESDRIIMTHQCLPDASGGLHSFPTIHQDRCFRPGVERGEPTHRIRGEWRARCALSPGLCRANIPNRDWEAGVPDREKTAQRCRISFSSGNDIGLSFPRDDGRCLTNSFWNFYLETVQ